MVWERGENLSFVGLQYYTICRTLLETASGGKEIFIKNLQRNNNYNFQKPDTTNLAIQKIYFLNNLPIDLVILFYRLFFVSIFQVRKSRSKLVSEWPPRVLDVSHWLGLLDIPFLVHKSYCDLCMCPCPFKPHCWGKGQGPVWVPVPSASWWVINTSVCFVCLHVLKD